MALMEGKLRTVGDAMILGAVGSWDHGDVRER
jgi:hypothetical protein